MWEQRARVMRPRIYHDNFHDLTFDTIFYLQGETRGLLHPRVLRWGLSGTHVEK
jgi:hypothetical protein